MAETKNRIVILDSQSFDRREGLAASFAHPEVGCEVIRVACYESGKGYTREPGTAPDPTLEPWKCLAVFIHAGDARGTWQQEFVQHLHRNVTKYDGTTEPKPALIYYTGGDPQRNPHIPTHADRFARPIDDTYGFPSVFEAQNLVRCLRGQSDEAPLLFQMTTPNLLITFLVLCQGYLLLHASGSQATLPATLIARREQHSAVQYIVSGTFRHLLPNNLPDKIESVKRPAWWLQPFLPTGATPVEKANFHQKVMREWNQFVPRSNRGESQARLSGTWQEAWTNLQALLTVLSNDEQVGSAVVADAYCALVDVLDTWGATRRETVAATSN